MENQLLVNPVKVFTTKHETGKVNLCLGLDETQWAEMNSQRKKVLDEFKEPFIQGALKGEEKPPFTKSDVMDYLQNNMSQQGILLLAAEQIGDILQQALNDTNHSIGDDPLMKAILAMMAGASNGEENPSDEE